MIKERKGSRDIWNMRNWYEKHRSSSTFSRASSFTGMRWLLLMNSINPKYIHEVYLKEPDQVMFLLPLWRPAAGLKDKGKYLLG